MMVVLSDYHGHTYPLVDSKTAEKVFDEQAETIMPTGTAGQSIWVGTEQDRKTLRIDIDIDQGRAALRWLPDGSYGVELAPTGAFTVLETVDHGPVSIPAELARVSVDTARRAVAEYVATGRRPVCVAWQE